MNRFNSLNSLLDGQRPNRITLSSELTIQKVYKLEGAGPYVYHGIHDGVHVFTDTITSSQREVSRDEMEKLIASNGVVEVSNRVLIDVTVPDYPYLDKFTAHTFMTPTDSLWDRCGTIGVFTRSELLDLNDMCQELDIQEVPTPGEPKYMSALSDRRWPLLKKYILEFSPDTNLPEEFA